MARAKKKPGGATDAASPGGGAVLGLELVWPAKRPGPPPDSGAGEDDLVLVERVLAERPLEDGQALLPLSVEGEGWRNLLVHGDNLLTMQALRGRLRGQIDLVYIDPPFATGLSYFSLTDVGDGPAGTQRGAIEQRAYRDQPVGGLAGYLDHMRDRLQLVHELLARDGKLFLHCDWRANSALRLLLDEIFGADCFRNEIIWRRAPNLGRQAASKQLGRVIDSILVYSKSPGALFPGPVPRRRAELPLDGKGKPKGARWDDERACYFTTAPRGDYTDKSIAELRKQGRVYDSSSGTVYIKYFLTPGPEGRWYKEQPVDALWDDYEVRPLRHRPKSEDMGYDTQKPEGLLERIIGWATRPGDLVADFFSGSATTAAVAEGLGRRWIATDIGRAAIDIGRRRLLDVMRGTDAGGSRGFEIRSVERLERRLWAAGLSEATGPRADADAVLDAFGAESLGERWGQRGDARVWVAEVEQAVSETEIDHLSRVAQQAGAGELVVLGWEWAAEDGAGVRARLGERDGLTLRLLTIPMEVVRRTGGRTAVRFAERPEVELEIERRDGAVSLRLAGVRCPSAVPSTTTSATSAQADAGAELAWQDQVDAWMVDWSFDGSDFEPTWRSYRSRSDRQLELVSPSVRPAVGGRCDVRVVVLTVYGDQVVRTLRVEC